MLLPAGFRTFGAVRTGHRILDAPVAPEVDQFYRKLEFERARAGSPPFVHGSPQRHRTRASRNIALLSSAKCVGKTAAADLSLFLSEPAWSSSKVCVRRGGDCTGAATTLRRSPAAAPTIPINGRLPVPRYSTVWDRDRVSLEM
jgi:hypothetical protein